MALIPFVVVGFSHVDTVTFFSAGYDGGFFHSGFGGVISAIAIMGWACQGTTMGPVGVVPITKNPKRTVPLGILIGCVVVSAVYGLMSYVAAGVLPYDQIAGENLSVPASAIMSPVLFAFFVIGGGVCATIPKKYPEQFAKRSIKCPVWLFNAGSVFGGLCALVIAITLFMDLTANLSPSNCRFSTLKNKFPGAHIEKVLGTSQDNRDYISKSGKWKDTEKGTTSVEGSFEEFGECPIERQGKGKEADRILELLKDGANNLEVIEEVPGAMKFIDKVERTRSTLRDAQFANSWRDLTVTYLFGRTGSGKTRSVMDRYGYANCYRVTGYRHPFDTYDG